MTAGAIPLVAGALAGLIPLAFGLVGGDEPARLERLLTGYGLAAVPYLVVVATWRRLPGGRRGLWLLLTTAIGVRLALVAVPPVLSEDVWRYVWDGAMHWAGVHPFQHPPADPALDPVAAQMGLEDVRGRIGHAHLATIYPPSAQLAFAAAAGVTPRPWTVRLLMVAADAVAIASLWRWAERTGRPPQLAALYAFLPLAILESAVGGHVDALAVAATLLAGLWLASGRPMRAGVALAVGACAKLLPVIALPILLRTAPRAVLACVVAIAGLWIPYAVTGDGAMGGLAPYAHRWRANEGAFAVIAAPYEAAWPSEERPLVDPSPATVRFVRAFVGVPPDVPVGRIFPDELSFAAAKATALALLGLLWAWLLWRARDFEGFMGPAVCGLLLLSPVVHPWYLLWVAPFCALAIGRGRRWPYPVLAWSLLAWIAYLPRPDYLRDGLWAPAPWAVWVEYLPLWFGLALCAVAGLASRPRCGGPASGTC